MKFGMKPVWFVVLSAWMCAGVAASVNAPTPRPASIAPTAQPAAMRPVNSARTQPSRSSEAAEYRTLLDKYCVTCHNERSKIPAGAPLLLDQASLDQIPRDAAVWEKVIRKLAVGAMPPQGTPHPEPAALDRFSIWLASSLDAAAVASPNPGPKLIHRLNRTEYGHAIRDLLSIDLDTTSLLPADSASYGFDNIADVLKFSPGLMEGYLHAAMTVSSAALGDTSRIESVAAQFPISLEVSQDVQMYGLPMGTRGGILVNHFFPADAEYTLSARLYQPHGNPVRGIEGQSVPQDFIITVDGVRVHHAVVGGFVSDSDTWADFGRHTEKVQSTMQVRIPVKAGMHDVGFTFLVKSKARPESLYRPFDRQSQAGNQAGGLPNLQGATIVGPLNPTGPGDTPSRRRILVCRPATVSAEEACAKRVLSTVARRAYRRVPTAEDLQRLMTFYQKGRLRGSFDQGVELALAYVLTSPSFLFRAELDPPSVASNTVVRVSDVDLASRLSFFLWSSIPDDELLNIAVQGKLKEPAVLEAQVRRMLSDPRSNRMVTNVAGQWLQLRNLKEVVRDLVEFPNFDNNLKDGFRRETEMLVGSIVTEDRSVLDLLNADYTFVNQRLAKHYGIPNVYGQAFRRVALTDPNRRGLLGQGSILLMTAHPTGSTPTIRGKWILENLLSTPPPLPPPVIPGIPVNTVATKPRTLRERLEEHRRNPVCASCHKNLDPPGFALENFDAVGAWRTTEAGSPIDASGTLADGTKVDSPAALQQALLKRPAVFAGTLTERFLVYGLGRGLEPIDMPVVRSIVRDAARKNYRFSSIIIGIVTSLPFQKRVAGDAQPAGIPTAVAPSQSVVHQ